MAKQTAAASPRVSLKKQFFMGRETVTILECPGPTGSEGSLIITRARHPTCQTGGIGIAQGGWKNWKATVDES